jgi:AbrB family looped-hinge helix DNA binding protein
MTYTLTVSSQGQIVIPSEIRKYLGVLPGSKIKIRKALHGKTPIATIEPPSSWVERVAGTATGMYGDVDKYIEEQRNSWDR